eukprot:TRINITY_DN112431_c0_g1_i1.p1 TRINITY_DN112431_c0_g1~~TRINITY_DN112431_c0_g1_i1.p1  ORF type:complete len:677 (-),score=83.83 TRINITY_DN112431_c0_g1_i1:3-2033(-)
MNVRGEVVEELQRERAGSSVDTRDLSEIIYGFYGLEKVSRIRNLFSRNPKFALNDLWWLGRLDRYVRACERGEEFVRLCREYNMSNEEATLMQLAVGEDFFLLLHLTMFLPCLQSLADDEQLKWWEDKARDFRIIGTYAQTELAHGSNVAGLETTAKYDRQTEMWVLDTPTLTSTKWWPGGLAKSSTHCILMARLFARDEDYGPHPFFLQVRDMNNHQSLPGVTLFDIGAKLGYNGMDNGALQLKGVRIPRRHLLGRYVKVDADGRYQKVGNPKMMYGTMTYTRKQLVVGAGMSLAKACIVATRYSAVRKQFPLALGGPEAQIIDYSTQQMALFPMIATAFATHFTGLWTHVLYNQMMTLAKQEDFSLLSEAHIVTSTLKAVNTLLVAQGIEVLRKGMGGHGFLNAAGLTLLYASYLPQTTYEGDYVVLSIQTGRALLKVVEAKMTGKDPPAPEATTRYIVDLETSDILGPPSEDETIPWRDSEWQKRALAQRSAVLIYDGATKLMQATQSGKTDPLTALDCVKIEMCRITNAHAHVINHYCFVKTISEKKDSLAPETYRVLTRLKDLFTLFYMEQSIGEFMFAKVLSTAHSSQLLEEIKRLLKEIRPDAVAIVDSWGIPDNMLNSALGRYDGQVYEALVESTKNVPLNASDVSDGYHRHIQYILHPERKGRESKL